MPLSVINAGFGRTGTMSIKLALEELGFGPCHHMEEVFGDPAQLPHWQAAARGEPVNWDDVFEGYNSAVDWPSAHYWQELADYYPESRVLLSIRSADSWWDSYSTTIRELLKMRNQIPDDYVRSVIEMANEIVTNQTFGGDEEDKTRIMTAFQERTDDVKAAIPAERLLIYQVSDGWEPLCKFLGVPVPDNDFPRSNAKGAFWDTFSGGLEH